jgi:hypothetical protein
MGVEETRPVWNLPPFEEGLRGHFGGERPGWAFLELDLGKVWGDKPGTTASGRAPVLRRGGRTTSAGWAWWGGLRV